jgi:hypothetical protein
MAKPSGKQLTIQGLLACGYEETFRSSKYRTFAKTAPMPSGYTWMVGKSGALRRTRGPLSASVSYTGGKTHGAFQYVGGLSNRETLGASKCCEVAIAHRDERLASV